MPEKRASKPPNPKLADLMQMALKSAELTIDELGVRTGLGRQVIGRIVRGETRRIAPEQVRLLVRELPITAEQLLIACGYDLAMTPPKDVPKTLIEAWAQIPQDMRPGVLSLVQGAAKLARQEGRSEP